MLDFSTLTPEQRHGYVLMKAYSDERKKVQQGYRPTKFHGPELLDSPSFKAFVTVSTWLQSQGFLTTWAEVHWIGFVEYAFKSVAPQIPQPGQLRNKLLLVEYMRSMPELDAPAMDDEELNILYSKVLAREVLTDPNLLYALGLGEILCRRTA